MSLSQVLGRLFRASALAFALLLIAIPATAQGDHHAEASHETGFRNEFMLFVGDTRKGDVNEFTVGLDYMRSIGHHWGAAVFLDYARGEFEREYIAGAGLFWAPIPSLPDLHLLAGAGWERIDEDHAHGHTDELGRVTHHWESEDVLMGRFGGSWLFHFGDRGRWLIAPQAFYDVVEGSGRDAVVFGVGFGVLF